MATDHALNKDAYGVDPSACFRAAEMLRAYRRPSSSHAWSGLSASHLLAFKITFIAVCHQFNWDFLQQRLADVLLDKPEELPSRLANVSAKDVTRWLSDYPKQERVRAPERSKLLRDVGRVLNDRWGGDAGVLLSETEGKLGGEGGLLRALDSFSAYRADPLKKKSQVLCHELIREDVVTFADVDDVEPAIDYHLMRIYLRTGRVTRKSKELDEFLRGRPHPRERLVRLLREAVSDAAKLTAHYAKISVPDLNYVEWQLGRSICVAENPHCTNAPRDELPEDVRVLVGNGCPFSSFCEAYNFQQFLREPLFEKSYY